MIDINAIVTWGAPTYFFIFIFPLLFIFPSISLFIILLLTIRWYIRGSMYNGKARDITGETVVITGGNTGIGKETARDLAKRGAKVIILCRDMDKGRATAQELSEETGQSVTVRQLDLASLESVRHCASLLKEEEPKIHMLINNAGVMMTPKWETKDGFEMQLGTNHFGHFLLTLLLANNVKAASPSRIINVSSFAHVGGHMHWEDLHMKNNYNSLEAYNQSKLANVLFTKSLAKKLKGTGVTTYALHPGFVKTELGRHIGITFGGLVSSGLIAGQNFVAKDVVLGAQTTIACAVDEKFGEDTGKYYSDCKEKTPSAKARNEEDAEKLWNISLKAVGLDGFSI